MFEWLNKQGVKSETGYVLQRMHRFYYHYTEGDHVLKVEVESNLKVEEVFLASTPAWEAPHESEPISVEKVSEIEGRIGEALKFMGIRYKIQRV